jgi:erythritol transport system ATP-binding protein
MRTVEVHKRYGGTHALKGVDFEVMRGKVTCLFGENGAGKSTLMKILSGIESPTSGSLELNREPIAFHDTVDARDKGISIIHQELSLAPNMSVRDNIFMGREKLHGLGTVDYAAQRREVEELMERLEEDIHPDTLVADLRLGQQQIVEIARALSVDSRILIMDEPTSALSAAEVEVLFKLIRELTAAGVSIVYISHHLEEAMEISDNAVVLRDGSIVAKAEVEDVDLDWIVGHMVGRDFDLGSPPAQSPDAPTVLEVRGVSVADPTNPERLSVDGLDLAVQAGEIVCLYGLMGAGRTELLETLAGRTAAVQGSVLLDGRDLAGLSIRERIDLGLGLVPEDRQRDGLVQTMTVGRNMSLASLGSFVKNLLINANAESKIIESGIRNVRVKTAGPDAPIGSLSGGNQQKVVIGKMLATSPRVVLLDEPSRGIDIGAKSEVFGLLSDQATRGLAVVYSTSEVGECLSIANRVIVMSKGRIAAEFTAAEATKEKIMAAWGGLREQGLDIPKLLLEGRAFIALIVIIVVFSTLSSNYFTVSNLLTMSAHVAVYAILAIGMLMVILNGGIDLSVGSTLGLAGVVAGWMMQGVYIGWLDLTLYPAVWVCAVCAIGAGALVGWVNGVLVAKFGVAPFVATLGTLYVVRGVALLITGGVTYPNLRGTEELGNTGFDALGFNRIFGVPTGVLVMLVLAVIASLVLTRTPFGRWLYASGGNERAAELSGIPVKQVKVRVYVISGVCAAIAGLIIASELTSANPTAGSSFELTAIAAVVIGGASLMGGRGNIRGTLLGAFVIGFLSDGLVIIGVSEYWQMVFNGGVIVGAVMLNRLEYKTKKAPKPPASATPAAPPSKPREPEPAPA